MISRRLEERYRELIIQALADDPDAVHPDILPDLLRRFAESVFSLYWDSGGPGGGAGTEEVYKLGRHYLTASADFGWDGPYDRLDDVLASIFVTGATREIYCSEWSEEEILDRIELHGEPESVVIQGTVYPFERLEHEVEKRR